MGEFLGRRQDLWAAASSWAKPLRALEEDTTIRGPSGIRVGVDFGGTSRDAHANLVITLRP
jgi:hypothetical protein